jgi:hypothetical protein
MMSKLKAGRYLSLPVGGLANIATDDGKTSSSLPLASDTAGRASTSAAGPSRGSGGHTPETLDCFTVSPERICTVQQSTSKYGWPNLRTRTSQVSYTAGEDHRRFRWLDYVPGEITCLSLDEGAPPVLTGKFSGCWLVVFEVVSTGKQYVGHIGTAESLDDERTRAVKEAWKAALKSEAIRPIKATCPSNVDRRHMTNHRPDIYGLVTNTGDMYTTVWQAPTSVSRGGAGMGTVMIDSFEPALTQLTPDFGDDEDKEKAGSSAQQ